MTHNHQPDTQDVYAQMLVRQNPWMGELLEPDEQPAVISRRKSEWLAGGSLLFIGAFALVDVILNASAFGGPVWAALVALVGVLCAYGGVWLLAFAKREYVLVTNRRFIHQKMGLWGRPGKQVSIPLEQIRRAEFLKSTVMYRIRRGDGAVSLSLKQGGTYLVSGLDEGQRVCEALGSRRQ